MRPTSLNIFYAVNFEIKTDVAISFPEVFIIKFEKPIQADLRWSLKSNYGVVLIKVNERARILTEAMVLKCTINYFHRTDLSLLWSCTNVWD